MATVPTEVKKEAKKELARRSFYDYCQLRFPTLYASDREYLKDVCGKIQAFTEQNEKQFLVINLPPRHLKSLTATNLVEWLFGLNPFMKVMTGSYNETLSTTFARKVRDSIDERKSEGVEVYNDIFPDTKIKYGQASKSLWSLEGSGQDNYLATSPTGTATGFGANYIILDDIIKNAEEAYNPLKLEKDWEWLTNTMLSRTEGNEWKVIAVMTRWAQEDLSGKIIGHYGDLVEVITFKAVQDDGTMLCDDILSRESYDVKTKEMAREIVEANYNQKPIDVEGRLYDGFYTYDSLPEMDVKYNYTDTADKGADYLCSVCFGEVDGKVYVLDVEMSDEPMEITEPNVADMLLRNEINVATIESNNGGRGFGRNIDRLLKESGYLKCVINDKVQLGNKDSRIISSSAWVSKNLLMPVGWISKWPAFATQLLTYQRKGKNEHDDAPDVLSGIYEQVTGEGVSSRSIHAYKPANMVRAKRMTG